MTYLFDTDPIIGFLAGQRRVQAAIRAIRATGAGVSIVTLIELYTGVLGSRDPRQARLELRAFLGPVRVLPLDRRVMLRTARLRHELRSQQLPITHRTYDLIVAATALTTHLTLVTSNEKDYQDIPGLRLFNPRRRRGSR